MKKKPGDLFNEFMAVVRRLRKDCPWDREQTHESIRHSLLEEAYEVVDAINAGHAADLRDELGDLLLHVGMHSVMGEEKGSFSVSDVLKSISEKLVRRHPHVFGKTAVRSSEEVKANWERLKLREGRKSVLDGVPRTLPALLKARRLQEKASKVGFDWNEKKDVWKKVREEIFEFRKAEVQGNKKNMEEEFGDLLFSLVNYSRFIGIHPELALQKTAEKFSRRFRGIEKQLAMSGQTPSEAGLAKMDRLWRKEKKRRH